MNIVRPASSASYPLDQAIGTEGFISDGDWIESKDQDSSGDVRLIQLADIGDGSYLNKSSRFLTGAKAKQLGCTFLQRGDILISRMPDPIGRACIFPGDPKISVTAVDVCIVRPDPAVCDANWLYRIINAAQFREQVQRLARGATRQRIARSELGRIRVEVPPLTEQRRIAAILDQADALRSRRRATLTRLDEMARAVFFEMFGDPASNPRNWPMVRIGEMLLSASYGTSEKAGPAGAFPVLRMNNITYDGKLDLKNLKYMDLNPREVERYTVRKGDILFNRTNSAELVGKTAVFEGEDCMAFAGYLVRLRTNEAANPQYVAEFLNSPHGKATLRGMCKSIIGMANINAREVQGIPIPKPPRATQDEFARRLAILKIARVEQQRSAELLDTLFTSIQHRAFRGEL